MRGRAVFPAILCGMSATLAGIGLARFAYTPLLTAVVQHHWFSPSAAAYLGAANLLGYLIGALAAHPASERYGARVTMAVSFIGIILSFILCALPAPFLWFFLWRFLSGTAGAVLMVVAPSTALASVHASHRGFVGTVVFMGIGVGTLVSALVVPLLLRISLPAAWLALGGASLIAALLGERAASRLPATDTSIQDGEIARTGTAYTGIFAVTLVMAAYGLEAVGYIPHTVFWVDFLARQVGIGLHAASFQWGLFGVGAIAGPLLTGLWVSRVGWHKGLATGFLIQCLAVSLPLITVSPLGRSISSLAVGAMVPGIVSLTSGRLGELVGMAAHKRVWGRATFVFAVAQAVAGYALSGLYDVANSYRPLFAVAGCVLVIGLALVLASGLPKFGLHPTEAEETPCG